MPAAKLTVTTPSMSPKSRTSVPEPPTIVLAPSPTTIRSLLVEQVTGSVRWRESVLYMAAQGVTEVWEIGAGKALSGMIRRIDRALATRAVGTPEDVHAAVEALNG